MSNKFFIYVRRSTDDAKRQVRSIKDQLAETKELARQKGLVVVQELVEKQSAKTPGRPVFNSMLARIEKGEASGIIAWHPNRLARNSLDGGQIIWLVDTGVIKSLMFPTYHFEPTPQGKLSLTLEFGIAKYYSDSLSRDIIRGIDQKLKDGLWPQYAPVGYLNDPTTKGIAPDPEKAPLVRQTFEMYASGHYTLRQVRVAMNDLGLTGKREGNLSTSNYQYLLRNPVYIGLIRFRGEYYDGVHEPLITKELFDRAQHVMSGKSKPKSDKLKPYLYRGAFHCGECGRLITTERQKGHNYLRCTKWEVVCSQPYVREEKIAEQITNALRLVALPAEWADWMLTEADAEVAADADLAKTQVAVLNSHINQFEDQLTRLLTAYVEKALNLSEYHTAKNKLMEDKRVFQEKLTAIEHDRGNIFEPLKRFVLGSKQAGFVAKTGTDEEKCDFFKNITSNPNVFNRTVRFHPRGAWQLVIRQGSFAQHVTAASHDAAAIFGETHHIDMKRTVGDSN